MKKWKIPLLFLLVIASPVLLASLALQQGWYHAGVRNQGQWIQGDIKWLENSTSWQLSFIAKPDCGQQCAEVPGLMHNIQTALGRQQSKLQLHRELATGEGASAIWQQHQTIDGVGILVLSDGQGMALLSYALPAQLPQWPLLGKAVVMDVQQLIKYQRGGQ